MDADAQSDFSLRLRRWFDQNRRALPWREQPSLYKTVVSEFMLQQTQVATVLPYFARWMERFPDFDRLACADEETVVKAWEGLGYYRRARNLHALARAYVNADPQPSSAAAWLEYPGIGSYTAAAIASIAHGETIAVVDGNVVRVLARIQADDTVYRDSSAAVKAFRPLAQALLSHEEPGIHNEAMMELGATVCTRATPHCGDCPVKTHCMAAAHGNPESYPVLTARKTEQIERHLAWCIEDEALLLEAIQSDAKRLAGMWELPELSTLRISNRESTQVVATRSRGISNQRIREHLHELQTSKALLRTITDSHSLRFIPLNALQQITLSGPHRKWITERLRQAT